MNNKIVISIVLVLVAVFAGYWAVKVSDSNKLRVAEPEAVVRFNCEDGKSFEAGFSEIEFSDGAGFLGIAALSMDDGREVTLEFISKKPVGVIYTNETGMTFIHSTLSVIEENGEVTYSGCTSEENEVGANDQQISGKIVSIDNSQVLADGPTIVVVENSNLRMVVHIPSMGINLCPAKDSIADVGKLQNGMTVDVRGIEGPDGAIVPCQSEDHYLRVVGDGDETDVNRESEDDRGEESVACTQEGKICPDGSVVGRVGPNCEFAACPGERN